MSEIIWESILHKVKKVPTPENTQAWSFRCRSDRLEIFWDPEKGKHFFDLQNHAACLSLGCLLEYIDVAAKSLLYTVEQEAFDHQGFNGNSPVAVLGLRSATSTGTELEYVLDSRSTNRGLFKKLELPGTIKSELNLLQREFPHLQISYETKFSSKFIRDLSYLEASFFNYPEYLRDLLKNTVFSAHERQQTKTGIYHEELSLFFLEKIPLYLAKKFPYLQKLLPYLGIEFAVKAHNKRLIKSSDFLILGTKNPGFQSLVDIGRAGTRAWLILNKNHYAVHPMTALALQVYELNTNQLPNFFSDKHKKLIKTVSTDYSRELQMKYPVWVLRYGTPRTLPKRETGLSLRRDQKLEIFRNQITG